MTRFADRVQETSTTTGTGTLTLAGAVTNYRTFNAAFSNGDLVPYAIIDATNNTWEVGYGTVGTGTLARTTVTASSNSGSLVSFGAGTKTVFCNASADLLKNLGATGAGGDEVFHLNSRIVTAPYAIPAGKSAIMVGPLIINTGASVSVPTGEKLVVQQ
jgi:hypothetical protein